MGLFLFQGNGGDASLIVSEPLGGQGMTVNVIGGSFFVSYVPNYFFWQLGNE